MNSEFLVTFSDRNFLNKNFTNKCTTMCSNCTIQSIQLDYLLSPYQTYWRFSNYPSLGMGITVFLMWKPPPGLPSSLFFRTSSARKYFKCETWFGLRRNLLDLQMTTFFSLFILKLQLKQSPYDNKGSGAWPLPARFDLGWVAPLPRY